MSVAGGQQPVVRVINSAGAGRLTRYDGTQSTKRRAQSNAKVSSVYGVESMGAEVIQSSFVVRLSSPVMGVIEGKEE